MMDMDTESGGCPGFFNGEEAEIAGSDEQGSSYSCAAWAGMAASNPWEHRNPKSTVMLVNPAERKHSWNKGKGQLDLLCHWVSQSKWRFCVYWLLWQQRITRGKHLLVSCLCHPDEPALCQAAICTDCIIQGDAAQGKRAGHAQRHWMMSEMQVNKQKWEKKTQAQGVLASLGLLFEACGSFFS